jgi:RNA polymerase sigma-70 factor (ECF subfamily)
MNPRLDPSDLVQETCLEAHRDLPDFRGAHELEFLAWLRRILENVVRDSMEMHLGAQKRSLYREEPARRPHGEGDAAPFAELPADQSSPSIRALRGELAVRLAAEIEKLPSDQREAVRLRHVEGWSLKNLAGHFQRSESAVAGLLKRGLRGLREQLADLT